MIRFEVGHARTANFRRGKERRINQWMWMLVGGLEHVFFSYIGNVIIPTDELIFFRGVGLNHQAGMVSEPCFSLIFSEPHEF